MLLPLAFLVLADDPRADLAAALAKGDAVAVRAFTAAYAKTLGDKAGEPEAPDVHIPIPKAGRPLTAAEAKAAFAPLAADLDRVKWWKVGLDPATTMHALREPAAVVGGLAAAKRAGLDGADAALPAARDAADFLVWAQAQAGTGGFPFPAYRGETTSAAFLAGQRYLAKAEKDGRLADVVKNGWAVLDAGDGGLQFDNGECGVALLDLYAVTKDEKYLAAARQAADWAARQPLVTNWNYNSFSVHLLARTAAVTGEAKYRDAAVRKAVVGVLPGQLVAGPRAGRWADAHNAKPAYHYIMLRGLASLAAVLPADHPDRPAVVEGLRLGLLARNPDFLTAGAPNKDKAMEALLGVHRAFAADPAFLADTKSDVALAALTRLVSEEYRRGKKPLGPREWGLFLEWTVTG